MDAADTVQVSVPGGELTVGVRDVPGEPEAPTLLLVHGVTASRHAWDLVAERLPGVRLIAPDLRGRGRSNAVSGEAGLARHADDLALVLDAVQADRVVAVGHSMGAFIAVVLAHRHPDRVSRLVLLDGGLPLEAPTGTTVEQLVATVLGPTAERLGMRFASVSDYVAFWQRHPAFLDTPWTDYLDSYVGYDLVGEPPELFPATSFDAMADDTVDIVGGRSVPEALAALSVPTDFVTVPRGLQGESPGLYPEERVHGLLEALPVPVRHVRLPDLNHYTMLMTPEGADAVATIVAGAAADTTADTAGAESDQSASSVRDAGRQR